MNDEDMRTYARRLKAKAEDNIFAGSPFVKYLQDVPPLSECQPTFQVSPAGKFCISCCHFVTHDFPFPWEADEEWDSFHKAQQ